MRTPRHLIPSEYIHVTQRGLGRRVIFEDDLDKRRYLDTLRSKLADNDASVLSWTLMDNHVHLLLKASPNSLSRLMQRLGISYAQYFNGCHGHVGKVFQNRFSSEAIDSNAHLLTAIRYIHSNSETAGIAKMADYRWSSYREIANEQGNLEGSGICDVASTLRLFGGIREFKRFHEIKNEQDGFITIGSHRPRMSDNDARSVAERHFGKDFADNIVGMPKNKRDQSLCMLKNLGLSIRQIERLTGIGRGPIAKA